MNVAENTLQDEVKEIIDQIVYLQIMGSFVPGADFKKTKEIVISIHDFIKTSSEVEIKNKLPELKEILTKMSSLFTDKFPLKRELRKITSEFNAFFTNGDDVYTYGLEFGWLDTQMDLLKLNLYKDMPYHYRIGLDKDKGNGSIVEDFLLKDAFNVRVKAEYYQNLLLDYGKKLNDNEEKIDKKEYSHELYQQIANIKYEVAALSRLTIISFYAFVEGFVNSVGHSYLLKNVNILSETEKELLKGFKNNGGYLSLKLKIEKFQKLIRADKKAKIIVSDNRQIPDIFKYFFDYYEQLRNSSVHYSPLKEKIWMGPKEWIDKAIEFSKLSVQVSLEFWKACYPNSNGPEYLGKLEYNLHLNKAVKRMEMLQKIDIERKTGTSK